MLLAVIFTGYVIENHTETSAQAPQGPVIVEGGIELPARGDLNQNGQVDSGDTLIFHLRIINRSNAEHTFATLDTGIATSLLYDIWNLRGAGSLDDEGGTITIPNLHIAPRAQLTISFEGTLKYFTETEPEIAINPRLLKKDKQQFGTVRANNRARQTVKRWEGDLPPWVASFSELPPTPELTPTPTQEPTPEPSPDPEPTPEPSPL